MTNLAKWVLPCTAAMFFTVFATNSNAAEWNRKTEMTFSGPVEVPGMVLPAGTYEFKLLDSPSDRNIVQIFNKDGTHIYATVLAIPDYRLKPTGKTVVTFAERAAGAPPAVQAWFYPGNTYGDEFVYPKAKAMELAKRTNQPVLSMPEQTAANISKPAKSAQEPSVQAMKKAPLKAERPSGEEVEIGEVVTPAPQQTQQTAQAAPANGQSTPANRLPATASSLPLAALMGLLSLLAAFAIRLGSKPTA